MIATQELKDRWLEALRSGKYKKGHYRLRTPDGRYCCLGVLCMTMKHPEGIGELSMNTLWECDNYFKLRELSGLELKDTDTLINMNDIEKATFSDIADYIETHINPRL